MSSPDRREFITVAAMAAIVKLGRPAVRKWINPGTLPAVRIQRRVRVQRSVFHVVAHAGCSCPATAAPAGMWDGEVPPPEGP